MKTVAKFGNGGIKMTTVEKAHVAVPPEKWEWFGTPGHFICAQWCQFHLCTLVGSHLVSTVGEYVPDAGAREILAESRGITLEGRGDERLADYMRKVGYEEIGCDRKYETMVFKAGARCRNKECGCRLPKITGQELDFENYNTRGDAAKGHMRMCKRWAHKA